MIKDKYEIYRKAFKETLEIIKKFPKNEYMKIPDTFIEFLETNMDDEYVYYVENIDDFQNQKMLEETKILLSIIYRDFIASSSEKKQILEAEKREQLY